MGDCVGLVTNKVVETVGRIGVDEAVANPLPCANGLIDIDHDFKGGFDTVFFDLASIEGGDVVFAGEAEDVEGFFAG